MTQRKRLETLLLERDRSNLKTAIACGEIFLEFEEKKRYSLAADHGITTQTAKKYVSCFEYSQKFHGEWSEEIGIISDSKLDLNQIIQYFTQETFLMWAASKEVDINVWAKVIEWLVGNKKRLTKPVYKQIESSAKALESNLIPKEIKKKVEEGSLPPSIVAPLVKAIEELPEQEQPLVFAGDNDFSADNLELITQDIKDIVKINESLAATLTLRDVGLDANALKEQLKRVEAVSLGASFISAMVKVEKLARKLKQAWEKLGHLGERLFVETGVSTPEIRKLLGCADTLTQNVCRIPSVLEDESFSITFNIEPIEQKTSSSVLEAYTKIFPYDSSKKASGKRIPSAFLPNNKFWKEIDIDEYSASVIENQLEDLALIADQLDCDFVFIANKEGQDCRWDMANWSDGKVVARFFIDTASNPCTLFAEINTFDPVITEKIENIIGDLDVVKATEELREQKEPLNSNNKLSIEFLPEEVDYVQGRYLLTMMSPWKDSYAKKFIDLYNKHEECTVVDTSGNEIGSILLIQEPNKIKIALKDLVYEDKYVRMSDFDNIISFRSGDPPETGLWAIDFIFTPSNYILRESCLLSTSEMSPTEIEFVGKEIKFINAQLKSVFESFPEHSTKSYLVSNGELVNYEWDLWEYDFEKNQPKTFAGRIYLDEDCLMVDDSVTHTEISDKIEAILNR